MHVTVSDPICVALADANGLGEWVPDATFARAGAIRLTRDEAMRLRAHVIAAIDLDGDGHRKRLARLDAGISECLSETA